MKPVIKVLQETPLHSKGTILEIKDFRKYYPGVVNSKDSDESFINCLKENNVLKLYYSKWFELVINQFKIGDWVWHEKSECAYKIAEFTPSITFTKEWYPNYTTENVANNCKDIYKRLATKEEIEYYELHPFCNGEVLISEYRCYYFNNVWKPLTGIIGNINKYLEYKDEFFNIHVLEAHADTLEKPGFKCLPNGLRVGCKEFSHSDIAKIAKILKLRLI